MFFLSFPQIFQGQNLLEQRQELIYMIFYVILELYFFAAFLSKFQIMRSFLEALGGLERFLKRVLERIYADFNCFLVEFSNFPDFQLLVFHVLPLEVIFVVPYFKFRFYTITLPFGAVYKTPQRRLKHTFTLFL